MDGGRPGAIAGPRPTTASGSTAASRWPTRARPGSRRAGLPELDLRPAAFGWTDRRGGRPLAGSVLYELHVGTFTPEGTLDAALERLDHLVDLGVTWSS